jgi:hypothetical protein
VLILIFTFVACKNISKNSSTSNNLKAYNWEHNLKTPKDKKKLLAKVIENGEVIKNYKYNDEGKLTYMREEGDYDVTTTSKLFYNQENQLKKKVIKEKGDNKENKIVETYKYDTAGNLKERLIKKEDKQGAVDEKVEQFDYDKQGRLIKRGKYNLRDDLNQEKKIIEQEVKEYDSDGRLAYRKLVNKNDYIDMEWRYKYNQYDKLIYKQILSYGEEKLLKKYTDKKDPKILLEKDIRNSSIYKYNKYQYNDEGKVAKKVDKANPDRVYTNLYSYNKKGLLKSRKQKSKGEVKHITNHYYDEKGELIKKKIIDNYNNGKEISRYKENEVIVKGYTDGELEYVKKGVFDKEDRQIRWYKDDIEDNKKRITEYRYDIKKDTEWKCKWAGKLVWWYQLKFDRENSRINIIKKNKKGEKVANTYFRYNDLNKKINFEIMHFLKGKSKYEEVISIEEIKSGISPYEWYSRESNEYNHATIHFGEEKILSTDGSFYDRLGNKLFDWESHDDREVKYNYIYK